MKVKKFLGLSMAIMIVVSLLLSNTVSAEAGYLGGKLNGEIYNRKYYLGVNRTEYVNA